MGESNPGPPAKKGLFAPLRKKKAVKKCLLQKAINATILHLSAEMLYFYFDCSFIFYHLEGKTTRT